MTDVNFDMLDRAIDELPDLKGFEPLPAGTYRIAMGWEKKEVAEKPAVAFKMKVLETIELANKNDTPPEEGKEADLLFILTNNDGEESELGLGQLKQILSEVAPYVGGESASEVMENSEGAEVFVTLKVRANKKDPDQKFNSLKALAWPDA